MRCGLNIYQSLIFYTSIYNQQDIFFINMIRVTINLVHKFSGTKIKIPQQLEGDKFCLNGKFNLAANSYNRVVQIMNSAKFNQNAPAQYSNAIAKLAACEFILHKNESVSNTLKLIEKISINQSYQNYFDFLRENNNFNLHVNEQKQSQNKQNQRQIKQLVNVLLKKTQDNFLGLSVQTKFPILSIISTHLNNRVDYKKSLLSLVERSPKSPKAQNPNQSISKIAQLNPNHQLQLLFITGEILRNKTLTIADKAAINGRANIILKEYQNTRKSQVYKPLLAIIMSLIGQKHYMSAEGMIGHVKSEQMDLINSYSSQDKNLVNNIYRMLVTRANNEPFETGLTKQEPVLLGNLVVQRIIKAPLLGHPIEGLIC